MQQKIKIGISSCLLGEKVRYDGGHKLDRYITETLGQYFDWVPVCPEVEYGLPVPREAMHLVGNPVKPRLVTIHTGIDHTSGMLKWAEEKIKELKRDDLCGFIFKSKSPSSGIRDVKVYTPSGVQNKKGVGIFGGAFIRHFPFIPVIDDGRLHDPVLRENFIERVFVFKRWKDFLKKGGLKRDLIEFHTDHKLLILSHSPRHLQSLGRLIGNLKKYKVKELFSEYIKLLMEGLSLIATVKKNTNVLLHIAGYFKKHLSIAEKDELLKVIEDYHKGYLPLIVPIVLLKHYVYIFDEPYLKRQYYLNPHPLELMLRNHS
ncbi:MAG: YbgA family protein [Thermodesulfovibrionales bacterium]